MNENDKRFQENMRVRIAIQDALLELMAERHISEISVSELISKAEIARASYYRNYSSLEEVAEDYIERMNQEIAVLIFDKELDEAKISQQNMMSLLNYYLTHRKEILLLYNNGFAELLQNNTDQYLINALGDMPANSISRYNLYLLSGAICRVQIEWLKNEQPEPAEEFAELNLRFIETNIELFKKQK